MALNKRLGITLRLLDCYPAPRRSFCRNVTRDSRGLLPNLLFFIGATGGRGKGSLVPALGLGRGLSTGYEPINDHFPSGHYGCILMGLNLCWLGYLIGGVLRFNRHVNSMAQRYVLC